MNVLGIITQSVTGFNTWQKHVAEAVTLDRWSAIARLLCLDYGHSYKGASDRDLYRNAGYPLRWEPLHRTIVVSVPSCIIAV